MSGDEFILSDQASPSVGLGMGNDQPIKWVSRPCLPNGDFRDDRERVGVRIVPLISYRYSSPKTTIGEKRTTAFSNANWVSK